MPKLSLWKNSYGIISPIAAGNKGWLVGWFYGISTFVGYLTQIHFYANSFKQFSLAWQHMIIKNISISSYSVYSNSSTSTNSV